MTEFCHIHPEPGAGAGYARWLRQDGAVDARRSGRTPAPGSDVVLPTHDDPFVRDSAEGVGGIAGTRVRAAAGFWGPLRVLLVLGMLAFIAGYLMKAPCHGATGFDSEVRYTHLCYSDIPYLYQLRGFADGFLPYLQTDPNGEALEYPVLTGFFMLVASWFTGDSGPVGLRALRFYDWNVILLGASFLVAVACTALTHRRRPWDAALLALAPAAALTAIINWDLFAVALTAGFLLAWTRSRPVLAGVLLGLAVSAKFYPVVLLGPLLLVCWRARTWRPLLGTTAAAVITWVVVNLSVYLANPSGWSRFYTFSAERGEDWGSVWYALRLWGHGVTPSSLNDVAMVALLVCCAGIALLAWRAPLPARLAQLGFLVVAAFCLTNKVYSPQYVLWLIPFAALARPRWRDLLIWQAGEAVYFAAIWLFLEGYGQPDNKGLLEQWYSAAIAVHVIATLYLCAVVVRDVLQPAHDPVVEERLPVPAAPPPGGAAPQGTRPFVDALAADRT